jgi:molybdenum cofactor synthesis domain
MNAKYKVAIVIVSDKASAGRREDTTGPALRAVLDRHGYETASVTILPDDQETLSAALRRLSDGGEAALVLTAGGTGFSPRDRTPEATLAVAERLAPGLAEAMRTAGMAITPRAMLSRGVAAIRGRTLIVNLPGSPKGACENLAVVLPALGHGLDVLLGASEECAGEYKKDE